jgi:hypothetical protein
MDFSNGLKNPTEKTFPVGFFYPVEIFLCGENSSSNNIGAHLRQRYHDLAHFSPCSLLRYPAELIRREAGSSAERVGEMTVARKPMVESDFSDAPIRVEEVGQGPHQPQANVIFMHGNADMLAEDAREVKRRRPETPESRRFDTPLHTSRDARDNI